MASVLKVDKLDPQSGTALELGTSGDTVSIPSGATLDISASTLTPPATMPASSGINLTALNASNLGSGTVPTARLGTGTASSSTVLYGDQTYKTEPGGDNTPYFLAECTSNLHSLADSAVTLIPYNTVDVDSDSAFDNTATNYKFTVPAGEGGKYVLGANCYTANATNLIANAFMGIYLNGTTYLNKANQPHYDSESDRMQFSTSVLADLSAADYVQVYVMLNVQYSGTWSIKGDSDSTHFYGYKLIG